MVELQKQLEEKSWICKLDLYSRYFEYVIKYNEIVNAKISVIVVSWRLHKDTLKSFEILVNQRKHNFELIFVDNGAIDGEFDSLIPFIDTYVKLNTNTGAYLARNIGSLFANAPILFFFEDDGIPDVDLIESHIEIFNCFDVIAVRGVCLYKTNNPCNNKQLHYYLGENIFPRYSDLEGNSSYDSATFYKVGGWDDEIIFGGGGLDLSIRLLKEEPNMTKQVYSPASVIFHDYVKDEEHLRIKKQKQLKSLKRLKRKHPEWDKYIEKWKELRNSSIKIKEKSSVDKFNQIIERVRKRNINKIEEIEFGKLCIFDEVAIENIKSKVQKYKYRVIFGAGGYGSKVLNVLTQKNITIDFIADNDVNKWGQYFQGLKIIEPSELNKDCFIFVASTWYYEIEEQLEKMNFTKNKNFLVMTN